MTQLPEFARQGLRRQPPGEHPDADVLTAFAEHSLTGAERDRLLAHLAACGACREVVSLATAGEREPIPIGASAAPARAAQPWLRWPVLHWGALAAVLLIVAAAVVQLPWFRPGATKTGIEAEAPARPQANIATDKVAPEAPPAQPAPAATAKVERPQPAPRVAEKKNEAKPAEKEQAVGRIAGAANASVGADTRAKPDIVLEPAGKSAPQAPQGLALQSVQPAPATAAPATGGPAGGPVAPLAPQTARMARPPETMQVSAAAPAATQASDGSGKAMMVRKGMAQPRVMVFNAAGAPAPWRVAPDGSLERMAAAGWERVPVAAGVVFRVVSVAGPEVWAGGAAGALYHSRDAGQTWQRVAVTAGDAVLSAEITRVDVTGAARVAVTAANGQRWTTSDGGATWSRQQ